MTLIQSAGPSGALRVRRVTLAAAAYIVASWVAGALTLPASAVTSFRPPNALLVAAALLDAPEHWWLYALATIPGNPTLFMRAPRFAVAGFVFANFSEVAMSIVLVRRLIGHGRCGTLANCARFVAIAVGASALASGIGAGAAVFERAGRTYMSIWRNWFFADALTYITLVPVILLVAHKRWRITRERRWEATGLVVGLVVMSTLALDGSFGPVSRLPALVYSPLPFLLWAAVRFGPLENALTVLTMSGVVLTMALAGRGAFAGLSPADSALSMQLLVFIVAVPLMFLAAVVDEHRESEERFRKIFHATPDAITLSMRDDGRLLDVNERFEQVSGIARAAAIGRTGVELALWTDT
ncbi:MAG TPA: MASE1 domain-containing protein, partial [Vicinamibacterales bacterium]|nr:MASE1 domain-containing protein [Vicinamibacterales bacterium]